jgi:predicted TPR repeat methyltransferase
MMLHVDCIKSKEATLRSFLEEKPKNAKVKSQLACLLADQYKLNGDQSMRDEAIVLSKCAIELAPHRPFGFEALSYTSENHKERMDALRQAVELSTDLPRIGYLVRLLVDPRDEEGRRVIGKVGSASSEHPKRRELNHEEFVLYNQIEEALSEAWAKEDTFAQAQKEFLAKHEFKLGMFFRKMYPAEIQQLRAKRHLKMTQQYHPTKSEMASFWLATLSVGECQGDEEHPASITKCPADYIVGLYSTFAARFDKLLVEKLHYQTPTKLRQLLDTFVDTSETGIKWERAVDLGCGTGLSGLAFIDVVQHLTGVDLSPEMIKKARERTCYDQLVVGDVTSVLDKGQSYDLVFACDVFVYFGDLKEVFEGVARSLSNNGLFCFSTEYMEESSEDLRPYSLQECARFAHKKTYLEILAKENGFEIGRLEICPIRKNQGDDVTGMLVVLRAV